MLPPAILLESRLLILAGPRIIRKSAQEATRVLFLTLFSGGVIAIDYSEAESRGSKRMNEAGIETSPLSACWR